MILSSNNYLGLSNDPVVVAAGEEGLEKFGAGTGSVRFICGTFTIHRDLEQAIADLVGTEASLSYVSAWNANEGLTATIVEQNDFVVSDALNHASIIDSVRLAKAITKCTTAVYQHSDLDDLRSKLEGAKSARRRIIWTDGVFSMEGSIAKLPEILQLAEDYDAIVAVDDSHGTGVSARMDGTAEHFDVLGKWTLSLDPRQGAGRGGRWIRGGSGVTMRHADPKVASSALLQRAPPDGGGQRARGNQAAGAPPGAGEETARQHALFSRSRLRGGVQTATWRDPDRPYNCRGNGDRHQNE